MSAQRSAESGLAWNDSIPVSPSQSSGKRRGSVRLGFTVLALGVALLTAAFGAGAAQAEVPKLVSYGNFHLGSGWFAAAAAVDNSCSLHSPPLSGAPCTAFDSSAGDVYVATSIKFEPAFELGRVYKFGASGEPLLPQSFGEGAPIYGSVAVDPANGDVYVLEGPSFATFKTEVAIYEPDGKPVLESGNPVRFEVAPSNNGPFGFDTRVQIAVDAAGDVYVPVVPGNEVVEYELTHEPPPAPSFKEKTTFTGGTGAGALKEPNAVALDRSGNLWVADAGNSRIEELNPTDEPQSTIASEGVEAVALDGHGGVLAIIKNREDCGVVESPCAHLVQYDSTGSKVADVGAGSFGEKSGHSVSTVAVDEASGRVYVTDPRKELVWIFGPPAAPVVGKELTAEVGTGEAKLGALVNPGGLPTSYSFEYGSTGAYGSSTPEGTVGAGVAPRTVWAGAAGLVPGTTYHYRVVVSNELGTVYGSDQTFTTPTAVQAACLNEEFRGGFSAKLPDCRAYELVIPPAKNSSQPSLLGGVQTPTPGGDGIDFETVGEPLPGAPSGGYHYVATRDQSAGWRSEDLIPLESYTGILCNGNNNGVPASSEDASRSVVILGANTNAATVGVGAEHESCNAEGLEVVPGEPIGYENLLLRENGEQVGSRYRLINAPPPGVAPADAHFQGASPDLRHVFFTEESTLGVPGASYGVENLFEWDEGTLRLLTISESGAPIAGLLVAAGEGAAQAAVTHPISTNGSHVLFTSGGALYDRIDGQRTVQVDKAQGGSGASGGGAFKAASADGTKVFFLDENRLTVGSGAASGEPDLYECVLPEGASECKLSDLTPEAKLVNAGEHANVLPFSVVVGSGDSSPVYFTARGVLASNKREYEFIDVEGKSHKAEEEAQSDQDNLYLEQGGTITFIATASEAQGLGNGSVSPDGTRFAFGSKKSLTGYENKREPEIFLYSAASGQIECASCNPSGETPVAGGGAEPSASSRRPVSDGGRVFFQTREALVPSDTNGQVDVYEFEHGQPLLISSGTSPRESKLDGASESGRDVFFESTQALVPQDTQEEVHVVYDAREGGGFPFVASPPACTTPEGCRGAVSPQASLYGAPASQTFSGAGNLAPPAKAAPKKRAKPKKKPRCKKGFVKRKGKCVKSKRSRKARRSRRARKSNHRGGR